MLTFMLSAKIHQARITHSRLDYEGSCAIDGDLLDHAGIREFEQIHIYNLSNGERFTTYAIRAEAGSGTISANGAAAHKAAVGDRVIICSYAGCDEAECASHKPRVLHLDDDNAVVKSNVAQPPQAATG